MYDFLKSKTVLYIEDEELHRNSLLELIGNYFDRFYTASSANKGYEIFKNKKVDIVITDIEMAGMNGLELFEKIRQENSEVHLVVLSAYTKTEYLLKAIPFKLEQYIVKPLTPKKLRGLLKTLNKAFSHKNILYLAPNIELDKDSSIIVVDGKEYSLTTKEYGILTILADKKVISYNAIEPLWGEEIATNHAIRSCIKKLRKKLPEKFLKTRSGLGYYIN